MDTFTLPGKLESLSEIRSRVNQAASVAALTPEAAYNLALAIDEIATNIVIHGYDEGGVQGSIVLKIEQTGEELIVVLEDNAREYDPRNRKMPEAADLNKPLEEREIGGLGVYLALQGVDRFDYERKADLNRNIFAMRKSQPK